MFWTEWGNIPKIEKAGMDGSDRTPIITADIDWPNGLAVDYSERKIYWVDAKSRKAEVADFNGKHRRTLISESTNEVARSRYLQGDVMPTS